jgi:hypothetical protein
MRWLTSRDCPRAVSKPRAHPPRWPTETRFQGCTVARRHRLASVARPRASGYPAGSAGTIPAICGTKFTADCGFPATIASVRVGYFCIVSLSLFLPRLGSAHAGLSFAVGNGRTRRGWGQYRHCASVRLGSEGPPSSWVARLLPRSRSRCRPCADRRTASARHRASGRRRAPSLRRQGRPFLTSGGLQRQAENPTIDVLDRLAATLEGARFPSFFKKPRSGAPPPKPLRSGRKALR